VRVEVLESMEPAQLRKQVKEGWVQLGAALFFYLFFFSLYSPTASSGWHIWNIIALAIQTAIVIYNVTALVKLKAYVRHRGSDRSI
jgi:hypothetical protein